jgi:hypothetical protein
MRTTQERLADAVDSMKDAMAVLAQEYMYPTTPGIEEDVNAVYAMLDSAKHFLHEVIDKMNNPEKKRLLDK